MQGGIVQEQSVKENDKRIFKNTVFLYIRMFIVMLVSLYTSRVVLSTLGVTDYGIFNVVAGVVVMMNVVNGAMSVSTQRYLTFALGKKDYQGLRQTFSMCMSIFIGLSVLVLILGETVGLWFVNTYLVIPPERMQAANWVYQFAILSCICTLLNNPYMAMITAHERMNVYAYVGIIEAVLKLLIVYLLLVIPMDRLIVYGFLTFLSSFVVTLIYHIYSVRHFAESRYCFYWDKSLFKQLASYSGWNLFGAFSGVAKGQGLNMLINMFFGPSVNASRGIAYQVNGVVGSFFSNFYTAVRPQITKYYAQGDMENFYRLVINSSKMAFFLILLISLPLIVEAPMIINLWLGQEPQYVVVFVRLIIMITAIDAMSTPLMTAIHATGNNRLYQICVGMIMIMTLPISYVFLKMGSSPVAVFLVSLCLSIISLFVRLLIASKQTGLPFARYAVQVVFRSILVAGMACILPWYLHGILDSSVLSTVLVCVVSVVSVLFFAYLLGFDSEERRKIRQNLIRRFVKRS